MEAAVSHNANYVVVGNGNRYTVNLFQGGKEYQIRMKRNIKKIWNGINSLLIGLVFLLAFALVGVRLFGLDIYVVLSGSMEPVYMTGSVIYVKDVDTKELQVDDDISYQFPDGTVATHRIIEVTEKNGQRAFRTKGIANELADGEAVLASNVIGKSIFTIPYLGYLVQYIHSTSGRYATIAVGAALLLMLCLPDILFGEEKTSKEKSK